MNERGKISACFYSKPDSGVLDRVCAPMDYGSGSNSKDGLNRYWFWDPASDTGSHTFGLVAQPIVDLQVLGEGFDPSQFTLETSAALVPPTVDLPTATVVSAGGITVPIL